MKSRKLITQFHFIVACLFLPLMLMMPLTGTLYLWDFKGSQEKTEVFRVQAQAPEETTAQEAFFREQFKANNVNFDFEYIRGGKGEYTFRPVTRLYYTAKQEGDTLVFTKVNPNLLSRMIELHKGHGPRLMRWFESAFGISLILVTLSGLWLVMTVPTYRRMAIVSFGIGTVVIVLCLI